MRNNDSRKKKFLALFLSVMMGASATAALASCTDSTDSSDSSSSSSSSTTSTPKDDGLVTNAGFETFDANDGLNLIGTSATGWTRSVNSTTSGSALSSKAASGIIDTAATAWDNLTKSNLTGGVTPAALTEEQASAQWSTLSAKDKLEYYEAWEDSNTDDEADVSDLDFYESFNIDAEDLPTVANPRTHDWTADAEAEDTNVLMIHNEYSNTTYTSFGTAQKYTSSSTVTVPASSNAEFSVWVKTSELKSTTTGGAEQAAVDKGAYIRITHTLGGTTLDPLEVKNINTDGVTENNGWVKYTFLLKSSSFADSTFTIVLGLGQSGGTDRSEYVNGYAFFDDIECKLIDDAAYTESVTANAPAQITHETEKDKKVISASAADAKKAFAIDFAAAATPDDFAALESANVWTFAPTTETRSGVKYTAAANAADATTYPTLGINKDKDKTAVYTVSEMNGTDSRYLQAVYDKNFASSTFVGADDKVLLLLSADGAAWTATSTLTTGIELAPDEYKAISFYVKTSAMNSLTGAGITLLDGTNKTEISAIDTTTTEKENEDGTLVNDGWQQCFFFVSNGTSETKTFDLSFTFGPTTVVDTTKASYNTGFAAFTKFKTYTMDETSYDFAASGTYSKIVTLVGSDDEAAGDSGFDAAATVPTGAIENGYANPKNYKGVYSDSDYVTANGDGTNTKINQMATAGLLSKKYVTNEDDGVKTDNAAYTNILSNFTTQGATAAEKWTNVFGDNTTQPLIIYNASEQTKSYGFIGKSTQIAASSYATVSLRVKVSDGAKAFIYLVDMDDDSHQSLLSVGGKLVYWYDDEGNVLAKDPDDKSFNDKRDVAFKLQANGLYKVNTSWNGASGAVGDKYYANLSAYPEKDENGNLLVAEGGVSYDYTDKWLNDGNDGIAFYYDATTQKYYADSAKTVEVANLADVQTLTPRYTAQADSTLFFEVGATGGEWATVTFYVRAGDTAKNYRLEVWSGARDNSVVNTAAGQYVIFDAYTPDAVDEKFATLLEQRQEEIDANAALGSYFESVFSFYDSDKFLRYDETADENGVGNSYESYASSSYTSSVAYLKYVDGNVYETYADYTLAETTVTADVDEDDSTTDEEEDATGEETNVWLLASSIAIAAVLVLAVVSLLVRKVFMKKRRNRASEAYVSAAKKTKKK